MKKRKSFNLKGLLFACMWIVAIGMFAQNITVRGMVMDATNEPIIGATIVIQGNTSHGTVTDIEGNYILSNIPVNAILQFSYVGMVTQSVPVNGRTTINIVLESDTEVLEEVVVVGYGTQKKVNLTGAVESVSGSVLENRPITNIGQGLQGVVPNLNISMNNGGAPGASSNFNIRGTTSLNGGSPLVLVDNVQMDPNLVNPDDIESISVLKDAASAAIYGARAAYGVILITTKKGKIGQKPTIQFSTTAYWQRPALSFHNVNSIEFLTMKDLAYQNSGGSGHYYNEAIYDYAERYFNGTYDSPVFFDASIDPYKYQYVGNTDWWNELYKTSFSSIYNASIHGGNDKTTYYASLGMNDQGGILKAADDEYRKYNANINVSTNITDWLNVSAKIMHTHTDEKHPTGGTTAMNTTAYSGLSAYSGMMKNDLSPLMPVKHPDGNYAGQGSYTNPVAIQAQGGNATYKQNDLWMTGAVMLTPIKGLIINADYTWNYYGKATSQHVRNFYDYTAVPGTENYYPWTNPNSVTLTNDDDYYYAINTFAEYSFSLAGESNHNFKVMAGYNQEKKKTKYHYVGRKNLIDNDNPSINLATGEIATSGSESQWAINGAFSRINYDYKGRYLLEMNGRYDGSSKFAKGHRYHFFPSVSAAWRISEETFWAPLRDVWDNMKIRMSYGSLGNQVVGELGNFPYLASYGVNTKYGYLLNGGLPVAVSAPGLISPSFTWETVDQIDIGFDASFLQSRLSATFDWYRRNTKDMLTAGQALPAVLGTSVPNENAADMKTLGWELSLGWRDRLSNGFNYYVKGVISDYQATITKFANPTGLLSQYYVGRKVGEIWGYVSNGLYQTDAEADAGHDQSYLYSGKWGAGDVKYEDLNGDSKINIGSNTLSDPGDRKIIGNNTPRYAYGITAGFDYKGFDFEMFWQGIGKRDYMPGGSAFWGFTSEWDTPLKSALDYWTEDNKNAYFARPNWNNGGNRQTSTRYLQDASYIRLKNVIVGYSLPQSVVSQFKIQRLRFFIQGENLFTFTSLIESFDPETIDNMVYPINKKFSLGLNLTF
ncbi:MAG: TonB-dependent receptor [Proteiniphilum sp.]|jgi:TonB-linked SusC/RagA family outer membrane protein|nr:TonB-dependent receptor [Proteiniphilum sp.]MEA5129644.1 TonB-dependent receptor [Proteiniphilum sp.]